MQFIHVMLKLVFNVITSVSSVMCDPSEIILYADLLLRKRFFSIIINVENSFRKKK